MRKLTWFALLLPVVALAGAPTRPMGPAAGSPPPVGAPPSAEEDFGGHGPLHRQIVDRADELGISDQTVEAVLASVGATYEQLVKLATELNWWPTPEAYPTANDLTDDLKKWVIRNKRGIGRAVMKAGGAL